MRKVFLIFIGFILLFSCKKQDTGTILQITIINGETNELVTGAKVMLYKQVKSTFLYKNILISTEFSDNKGNAKFSINFDSSRYWYSVIKDCMLNEHESIFFPPIKENTTNKYKSYLYNQGLIKFVKTTSEDYNYRVRNSYGSGISSHGGIDECYFRSGFNTLKCYVYDSNNDNYGYDDDTTYIKVIEHSYNIAPCDTIIFEVP